MRFAADKLAYVLLLMLVTGLASAQENRLALVIGNSDYKDSPLRNPLNDANDMASALEDLDFEVMLHTDADRREMGRAIRDFGNKLKENRGVGLFYYAGHGMQIEDSNFLIPVDTPLEEEDEVPYESVDVGSVLAKMESAGNSLNLIILDACRNNPFPRRFRSTSRGLARVEAPIGSLVVYATAPGAVAADGEGRNGVFTGALLEQLRTGGQSLSQTIRRTRAAVVEATNGQQVPWESSSLLRDYYFSPEPEPQPAPEDTNVRNTPAAVESRTDRLTQSAVAADNPSEQEGFDEINVQVSSPATVTEISDDIVAFLDTDKSYLPQAPGADSSSDNTRRDEFLEPDAPATGTRPPQTSGESTLNVNVEPADARVRIMDIVDAYTPGMSLSKDRTYDLFITREGYDSYREDITLKDASTLLDISLNREGVTEPEMASINGGTYTMGCSSSDQQCEDYEKPAHSISVAPYAISVTEVTVGQFDQFVTSTGYVTDAERDAGGNEGCFVWSDNGGISRSAARWGWEKNRNWRNPGYKQGAEYPVTCISWNDASKFVNWLADETGRAYRLPSESQWELAARGGSSGPWGSSSSSTGICEYANVADRSQSSTGSKWNSRVNCSDNRWFSAPVASYKPNGFGLFDMQGNTWEWVADTWADGFSDTPVNGEAYVKGSADERVLRGGGWDSDAKRARLSSRSKASASGRAAMTGFRLVLEGETR